jgi:hypothetical protein
MSWASGEVGHQLSAPLEAPSIMTKKAVHQNVDLGKTRSSDMKRKSFAAQQQTIQTLRNLI